MAKVFCVFIGLLLSLSVIPVSAQQLERGASGKLGCIGNHKFRLGGGEISLTSYVFRNFNPDTTLTVTGISFYAADGTVLLSMPGFVLGPNRTASFDTIGVFGSSPSGAPTSEPLQVIVNWTASARALDLFVTATRQERGRDTTTGALLEQRTRSGNRCVTLR